jgi:hypothetical protein
VASFIGGGNRRKPCQSLTNFITWCYIDIKRVVNSCKYNSVVTWPLVAGSYPISISWNSNPWLWQWSFICRKAFVNQLLSSCSRVKFYCKLYIFHKQNLKTGYRIVSFFGLWCLMPLSTIFIILANFIKSILNTFFCNQQTVFNIIDN